MVRIPHGHTHPSNLAAEVRLLQLLERGGVPASPRDARLIVGRDGAPLAMTYDHVEGVPSRGIPLRGAARERFAADLGAFLGALHAVPVTAARATGVPSGDPWRRGYVPLVAACRAHLDAGTAARLDAVATWFAPMVARAPRTLVHGDISGWHTLVGEGGRLAGVIDFGEAGIGDPALDLAGVLNDRSRAFLGRVIARSPRALDAEVLVRAEVYIALAPLFTLRTALRTTDASLAAAARRQLAARLRTVERGEAGPYHRPARSKRGSRVVV